MKTTTKLLILWMAFLPQLVFEQAFTLSDPSFIGRTVRAAAGGGGGQAFSDDFNRANASSLGANWTANAGEIDIASNEAVPQTGSYGKDTCIYTNTACDTVNQYVRVTFATLAATSYAEIVFRFTDDSTHYYAIQLNDNDDTMWWQYLSNMADTSGTTIQSVTSVTIATGDIWGFTITGTGASTVIRAWRNPTATTPVSASEWDSGDTTPEVTFSNDPGGNAVDSGNYVGIECFQNTGASTHYDNFYGGDL